MIRCGNRCWRGRRAVGALLALMCGCTDTGLQDDNRGVLAEPEAPLFTRAVAVTPASVVVVVVARDRVLAYSDAQKQVWQVTLPPEESLLAKPAVTPDSTTYLLSSKTLRAIDAGGKQRFRLNVPFGRTSVSRWSIHPLPDSTVALSDGIRTVVALDAQGKRRWRYQLPREATMAVSPVTAANGSLYLRTAAWLYSIGPEGKQRWRLPLRAR